MKIHVETKTCLRVGITVFLLYLGIHYWPTLSEWIGTAIGAASPLLIGCAIAYVINILMRFYERHYFPRSTKKFVTKTRRPLCLLAALVTLVAVIALIVLLILPQLIACIQLLLAKIPEAIKIAAAKLDEWKILPEDIFEWLNGIDWKSKLEQILGVVTSGIGNVVGAVVNVATSVVGTLITVFVSLIFSFYLLIGKERLAGQSKRLLQYILKPTWYEKTLATLHIVDDCFHRYIVGQCTEAVILGVLCALGMWILRLPYAAMIGALIAFTALIPVAGAYIGGAIGAFMILTESPIKAIIFVVFLVILQQLEGNLIYPKVVGSSMGLPGIWVLAAVTIGGGVMGILGMLIGVPLAAALYRILQNRLRRSTTAPTSAADPETKKEPPDTSSPSESDPSTASDSKTLLRKDSGTK